jgi:ATP-dependent Clp protease ATP-binding subunit ClpC
VYPFERFTERAKGVLTRAEDVARLAQHAYIGTEHLLVALLGDDAALAAVALSNLGVEINRARAAAESLVAQGERRVTQQIIPSLGVKKAIDFAVDEASRLKQAQVTTEHLLLGIIREGKGMGAQTLGGMGITVDKLRAELERLRSQSRGEG